MTRILFFGALKEKAGGPERLVHIPRNMTIDALIDWLSGSDIELRAALTAQSVRVAVDQALASCRTERVGDAEEIAFMPAYSGG